VEVGIDDGVVKHGKCSLPVLGLGEAQATLAQADEALAADDDVVEDIDAEELASLHHLAGHLHVVLAGRGVAGGVVVHHDEGRAALADGPKGIAATPNTVYHWHSATKIVAAIATMQPV